MTPEPEPTIPVSPEPSPVRVVAVRMPVTFRFAKDEMPAESTGSATERKFTSS